MKILLKNMQTINRRTFVKTSALGLLAVSTPILSNPLPKTKKLTILHTNDLHSRIEAFPMDGGRYEGMGGAAKRAALIQKVRNEESNVLLFDCGDILQGTPYFNFYHGELEFKLMNEMGYDAATIGNHDFDAGIEQLASLIDGGRFAMLNANYVLQNTPLEEKVMPYKVFVKDGIKVGVFGLGIALNGLVPQALYGETLYQEPIAIANETARKLKEIEKCQLVICLSHLGYKYESDKVSDVVLAKQSKNIDVILGGHTHTFMEEPDLIENLAGETVVVNQVGWAGIKVGRLDFWFERSKKNLETNFVMDVR